MLVEIYKLHLDYACRVYTQTIPKHNARAILLLFARLRELQLSEECTCAHVVQTGIYCTARSSLDANFPMPVALQDREEGAALVPSTFGSALCLLALLGVCVVYDVLVGQPCSDPPDMVPLSRSMGGPPQLVPCYRLCVQFCPRTTAISHPCCRELERINR